MVVNNAGRIGLIGTLAGTLLSFAFLRVIITNIDAIGGPSGEVWLVTPLLPVAAVLIASLIPARRAAGVSPMDVLRDI